MNRWMFLTKPSYLYTYIRYFDVKKGAIFDEILGCKQSPEHTKGEDIFKIFDNFKRSELDLQWEWCVSVSTDGAASMTGHKSGLVARIREINPKITGNVASYTEKAWSRKKTSDLHETLNIAVKVVNLNKSRALNSRLFKKCARRWDPHTRNCFCTPRCDGYHEDAY
jgi:hypothetical protein